MSASNTTYRFVNARYYAGFLPIWHFKFTLRLACIIRQRSKLNQAKLAKPKDTTPVIAVARIERGYVSPCYWYWLVSPSCRLKKNFKPRTKEAGKVERSRVRLKETMRKKVPESNKRTPRRISSPLKVVNRVPHVHASHAPSIWRTDRSIGAHAARACRHAHAQTSSG